MNNLQRPIKYLLAVLLIFSSSACAIMSTESSQGLTVLAGSELRDLEPMLDQIHRETGVRLQMQYIGTLDGAEKLILGEEVDFAWFSHAKYLNLLEGAQGRVKAQEKIMLSPVVLGVKESLARQWGWMDNSNLTWREVVAKASSGELRYAMTNPTSSNSGFSALVGAAAALSGKADALQAEDISLVSSDLQSFFKGQTLTAGSSGWLADQYLEEQNALNSMINYESVLLNLNKSGRLEEKLFLVYPKEGIITADYPLLLINESKREEYNKLVEYLGSPDFQKEIMQQTLRRPVNSQVPLSSDFPTTILIELPFPSRREVVDQLLFSYLDEQIIPSHTFYVLDVSGSMRGDRMESLKNAMDNLTGMDTSLTGQFARFRDREKITMITFNHQIVNQAEFEIDTDQPESFENIRRQVDNLQASGNTAIYSALQKAYREAIQARQQDPDRNYSIVLMSDGINNAGLAEMEFLTYVGSTPGVENIRTFTILFGEADEEVMQKIADATAGRMFDASEDPLSLIFKEIRGYQ
jgi:Ca-activated chloride channel homolog